MPHPTADSAQPIGPRGSQRREWALTMQDYPDDAWMIRLRYRSHAGSGVVHSWIGKRGKVPVPVLEDIASAVHRQLLSYFGSLDSGLVSLPGLEAPPYPGAAATE